MRKNDRGPATKSHRRSAWFRGQAAERYASLVLRFKGYRILARQYRTPLGEIDIIAQRGGSLVFLNNSARNDSDPRWVSSYSLVISRLTEAGRGPRTAAISARLEISRRGLSINTSVAGTEDSSPRAVLRALLFGGKKPWKKNRSEAARTTTTRTVRRRPPARR